MPLASEDLSERRTHTVGDDDGLARDLAGTVVVEYPHRGDPARRVTLDVNGLGGLGHLGPGVDGDLTDLVVQFGAAHRAPGATERRSGPWHFEISAKSVQAQTPVSDVLVEPGAQAQQLELFDGARGQSVAARLVSGEHRRIDQDHLAPRACGPRRGCRSGWAGTDDDQVR
ncbi:Uncharacterised protein [Mycobacteroides abscessus subsp. abscessus]|nr:Uncharacterised protein [Mycobacteroides abscessus subsp. abscessus]